MSERRGADRDVREEMHSIGEDVEDLWKAVGEFEIFDQCMYTIGVSEFGSRSRERGTCIVTVGV